MASGEEGSDSSLGSDPPMEQPEDDQNWYLRDRNCYLCKKFVGHCEPHKHIFEEHLRSPVIQCPIEGCTSAERFTFYESALVQNHVWTDHHSNQDVIDRRGDHAELVKQLIDYCFKKEIVID